MDADVPAVSRSKSSNHEPGIDDLGLRPLEHWQILLRNETSHGTIPICAVVETALVLVQVAEQIASINQDFALAINFMSTSML